MRVLSPVRARTAAVLRRIIPFRARVAGTAALRRLWRPGAGLASPADLRASYRLLLGRQPDRRGELDFLSLVERGITRDELVRHFLSSPEFRARQTDGLDRTGDAPATVVVDDLLFHLDPNDFAIGPHLVRERAYEPAVLATLRRYLSAGDTFVDVGASFGYFSTQLGRHVGPRGTVIAFEPGPQNQSLLLLNLTSNGILGAEVRQVALSDQPGLFVYSRSGANGAISAFSGDARQLANHDLVQASTLDRELAGRVVHAIKIDAEGAEGLILFGGRATLRASKPTVVFEFSPPALESVSGMPGSEVLGLLVGLGYRLDVIGGVDEHLGRSPEEIAEIYEHAPEGHIDLVAWTTN